MGFKGICTATVNKLKKKMGISKCAVTLEGLVLMLITDQYDNTELSNTRVGKSNTSNQV